VIQCQDAVNPSVVASKGAATAADAYTTDVETTDDTTPEHCNVYKESDMES
jgi:hypothetical protein